MATIKEIVNTMQIPKSTLYDWKNADDYKRTLFYALKSMSVKELEAFKKRGEN